MGPDHRGIRQGTETCFQARRLRGGDNVSKGECLVPEKRGPGDLDSACEGQAPLTDRRAGPADDVGTAPPVSFREPVGPGPARVAWLFGVTRGPVVIETKVRSSRESESSAERDDVSGQSARERWLGFVVVKIWGIWKQAYAFPISGGEQKS